MCIHYPQSGEDKREKEGEKEWEREREKEGEKEWEREREK